MTTLEKIVKEAKSLKKSYPKKFEKWTDYIKEASKKFRSTTTPAKKKSKIGFKQENLDTYIKRAKFIKTLGIGAIPVGFQATFRGNPFYLTNQYDIFNNISLEVTDKKTNEVFAVIDKNSKTDLITDQFIIWLKSKGVNIQGERDLKSLHKEIKPLAVNLLQEVKAFNKGKKKAPIKTATKKKAPKKQAPKKQLTNATASELIRKAVKKRKLIMPHGYEVRKSKLAGIKKRFNPQSLIGKEVFKNIGAKDIYTIIEVDQISANNIKLTLEKNTFSIQASFTFQNLIDLSKGKIVKNLKLINKITGSKITPQEHYLSYASPSKPSEQAIYKGIERVKQDILRLQGMQKDHMFKKHKASLNGAINTKNREIKELLKKLK